MPSRTFIFFLRYKIGLQIEQLEDWDADADHELVVVVGPAEAATQRRDKIKIAVQPSEIRSCLQCRNTHILPQN